MISWNLVKIQLASRPAGHELGTQNWVKAPQSTFLFFSEKTLYSKRPKWYYKQSTRSAFTKSKSETLRLYSVREGFMCLKSTEENLSSTGIGDCWWRCLVGPRNLRSIYSLRGTCDSFKGEWGPDLILPLHNVSVSSMCPGHPGMNA
jgi:hypothetical protein